MVSTEPGQDHPCNPTGKLVEGEELERWVSIARELDCTLLRTHVLLAVVLQDGLVHDDVLTD